jgi:hypothetical protein
MLKLAATLVCVLGLAGCSAEVSTSKTVSQSEVEKQVAGALTVEDGVATPDVTCSGSLDAAVDATQDCHLESSDVASDVRVTVTSVDGSDAEFDIVPFLSADFVAEQILGSLSDQGYQVDTVECEGELLGVVDETVACTAQPSDGEGTVEATVTSVDGLDVNFDYEVVS